MPFADFFTDVTFLSFSMTIYLVGYVDLKWIPLLVDPALVGSVATTSGSSEIGVVGRERESEKGTEG